MNADLFLRRVVFLAKNFGDYDMEDIIKLCLLDIDMDASLDGFKYLVFSCVYYYQYPEAMFTKHIYPAVANEFGCRNVDVEISIRRAIRVTWKCRSKRWLNYFSDSKRPTNGEFVSIMAEVLNFWNICRNNLMVEGVGERE